MLSLASSTIIVKPWCSMMESPGKIWSVGKLVKVREWCFNERSPPIPRVSGGRSGGSSSCRNRCIEVDNLLSCRQATCMFLLLMMEASSAWQCWTPLQLNCKKAPPMGCVGVVPTPPPPTLPPATRPGLNHRSRTSSSVGWERQRKK